MPRIPFTDLASSPEFKALPPEDQQVVATGYWDDVAAERPDQAEFYNGLRDASKSLLDTKTKRNDAPPVLRRFLDAQVQDLAFDLSLGDELAQGRLTQEGYTEALKVRDTESAQRQAQLDKTRNLFSDDPKKQEALAIRLDGLEQTAITGGVFGSSPMKNFADLASDVLTFNIDPDDGMVSSSRDAYAALKEQTAKDYGLEPDEVEDLVKHRLGFQEKPVSLDPLGNPFIKPEIFAQGPEAVKQAILTSDIPWSKKQELTEKGNLAERVANYYKTTVEGVKTNHPELARLTGVDQVQDPQNAFSLLQDGLAKTGFEKFSSGVLTDTLSTLEQIAPALTVDPLLKRDAVLPTTDGVAPETQEQRREKARKPWTFARRAQESANQLSQEFYKNQGQLWGVDMSAFGSGAGNVLTGVALGTLTGGASIPMTSAKVATMGPTALRMLNGANSVMKVSPTVGLAMAKTGTSTYENAIKSGMTEEEAGEVAILAGAGEGVFTGLFSFLGLSGVEGVGEQLLGNAARQAVRESSKSIARTFGGKLAKGIVAEQFEEGTIAAFDAATVQARINPKMTTEDFLNTMRETALVTFAVSGPTIGVGSLRETLAEKATYQKTDEELQLEANLNLADAATSQPGEADIPPGGTGPADAAPDSGAVVPGAPEPVAPGGTPTVAPVEPVAAESVPGVPSGVAADPVLVPADAGVTPTTTPDETAPAPPAPVGEPAAAPAAEAQPNAGVAPQGTADTAVADVPVPGETRNPAGSPSEGEAVAKNLTSIKTPEDSKPHAALADDQGNPKRLFHGKASAFKNTEFQVKPNQVSNLSGLGPAWFTTSQPQAERFVGKVEGNEGEVVEPTRLDVRNPLVLRGSPESVAVVRENRTIRDIVGKAQLNDSVSDEDFETLKQYLVSNGVTTVKGKKTADLTPWLHKVLVVDEAGKAARKEYSELFSDGSHPDADPFGQMRRLLKEAEITLSSQGVDTEGMTEGELLRRALEAEGKDGIVLMGTMADTKVDDDPSDWVVPFRADQVIFDSSPAPAVEEAPAETFREPEPDWGTVFERLREREQATKQVDTESPKFKELVTELKNNRVAEAAGKLEQRKADIAELEKRIAKERKERNETRKEQNRFRMKNKPLDEHQEKIKQLTGHGHGFTRGIKDFLVAGGLDPNIKFNDDWRAVALRERKAKSNAKTERIHAQFDKLTPEAKEVVEAFHKMGKKPIEEKESLELFWNTNVGKGIKAYGGLQSKKYFTDRGLPVPSEYDGLSERVPPHIGTAIFRNSDTVGSVDQVATAAGLTVNEFWTEFWNAVGGISTGKDSTQDDYNERKQREAEDREIAFAEQQLKALEGDAQTVDLREVRDGDKFTLGGTEYTATGVEYVDGRTDQFTLRGKGPLDRTTVTEDFFVESVTPTEGSLAGVDPAEVEAFRVAQQDDSFAAAEAAPTSPVPYSPEALKETFDVSDEQAVAMDALVRAMGLDTSRIQLQRGGVPSDAAMRQEMDARDVEYLAAVEAGDMAKAQAMVDAAARAAGYDVEAFHGTDAPEFTEFETERSLSGGKTADPNAFIGSHFSKKREVAEKFAAELYDAKNGRVMALKLRLKNPLRVGRGEATELLSELEKASEEAYALEKSEDQKFTQSKPYPTKEELEANLAAYEKSGNIEDLLGHQPEIPAELKAAKEASKAAYEAFRDAKEANRPVTERELLEFAGFDYDKVFEQWERKPRATALKVGRRVREALEASGYDGVTYSIAFESEAGWGRDGRVAYIALYPEQIKSADPVTRDADGNVIPLSQRFNPENPSILYQNSKGSFEQLPETGDILLRGLSSPDVSTGVHEIAHAARRTILNRDTPAEARAGITDADIAVAEEWAGAKDGVWSRAAEEKFARGWERYLRDGKSPVAALQGVFDKMAAWLRSIYVTVAGSPIDVEISPEMRAVFDKLVSRTLPQPQAQTTPVQAQTETSQPVGAEPAAPVQAQTAPEQAQTPPPPPAEPTPPQARPVQPGMAEVVSTQNAATDAWREANGFPPIFKNNPVTFTQYWQDAQKLLKQDPDAGKKLVARMKKELFQPDTTQVMLILNEMLMAKGAMERALYERNLQGESATADQIAAVNDALAYYAEMTLLNSRVGSIQATAFGARKVFVTDELDIGVIAGRIQHAQGGKKLSKEQSDELEAAYAKIKAFEEREKVREAEAAEDNAQQVFENMVVSEFKKDLREGQKQGEKPLTALQRKAQESREWLRQNIQGRANMNFLPAQEAYHVAVVGVSYIVEGASAIGAFTTRLIKDFGKRYLPFARDIYKKSQELHQTVVPKAKKIKPRQEILDGIDPGEMVNGKAIYQLVRYYVNEGLQTFEEVMTAVHTDLRQSHPNLTMREVHDAFSNYGITTQPNQEKDAKTARKYREMARYSSQLEDAMAKSYPKKTGPQRDPQEQEVRDLAKQVRDTIRKFNLRPKNDKEQLKSTFDAIKTRLKNEFEDYDTAVKKGEERKAREPQKFTAEEEAELKDLRQKRDDRKKDYEAIFKKKGLTTEQRIERMEALLDRRIEEERKMLEEGILKRDREMQMGPWTPALRKQQETLNKLKADRRERQKAARPKKPEDLKDYERKLKSLDKRIKEEEDLLAAGLTARQKNFKMGRWTPEMAEMQARLDALRDDRRELAKKQAPKKSEEQTAYDRSVRAIEAAIQRYNDIINAIKKPGKPTFTRTLDAEMQSLLDQRDALRDAADAVLEADPERKDKRKQDLLKVLNKSINEITRKIQDGDFSTKTRKPGEFDKDPDVVSIRAARDLLNKTLAAMRKVDPDAAKKQLRDMIAKREAELSKGITLPDTEEDPFAGDEEIQNLRTALDLLSDIKRIKTSTAKIQARLDAKDYTKSVKPTPKTSKAREDAIMEHNRLKSELNRMVIQTELDNRSFGQLVADRTNDLLFNVSRTLTTSADAGTIGRQTQLVAFTRPGVWAKSLPSHFAFAKKHAERVQARVENHPDYDVMMQAGLNLGSWQEGATFDQMNEEMRSEILRLIPGVGKVAGAVVDASVRAYVSGINSVRAPYFSLLYRTLIGERKGFSAKLTNKLGGIGLGTQKEIEYLARHVEIATGRGNLGAFANSADFLSKLLFSPRYWLSRLQIIGHFPVLAVDLMTGFKLYPETRAARKVVAMEYARMAIGVAVYYNFLSMVKHLRGWDDDEMYIEEDPRSSDFGKVKIGNTRIDPMAGMLQNIVFVSRTGAWMLRGTEFGREAIDGDKIVGGKLISMRDAKQDKDTMASEVGRMIRSKLAPWPSAIWNVAAGEDAVGNKVQLETEFLGLYLPLSQVEIYNAMQEHGANPGLTYSAINLLGWGVSTYGPGTKKTTLEQDIMTGVLGFDQSRYERDDAKKAPGWKIPKPKPLPTF